MLEGGSAAPWQIRRYREDSGRKEAIQGQLTWMCSKYDSSMSLYSCAMFEVCIYQSCSSNQLHNVRFAAETIDGPMAVGCEACSCEIWHQLVV